MRVVTERTWVLFSKIWSCPVFSYDLAPCCRVHCPYSPHFAWRGPYCKIECLHPFFFLYIVVMNVYMLLQWMLVFFNVIYHLKYVFLVHAWSCMLQCEYIVILKYLSVRCTFTNTTNYSSDPFLQFKCVITFIIPNPKSYTIPHTYMKICVINTSYHTRLIASINNLII